MPASKSLGAVTARAPDSARLSAGWLDCHFDPSGLVKSDAGGCSTAAARAARQDPTAGAAHQLNDRQVDLKLPLEPVPELDGHERIDAELQQRRVAVEPVRVMSQAHAPPCREAARPPVPGERSGSAARMASRPGKSPGPACP